MPEWNLGFDVSVSLSFLMVVGSSWAKFDEPTYPKSKDSQGREYYRRFKPSYITLRRRFYFAKAFYLALMAALFAAVVATPELSETLQIEFTSAVVYPFAVAAALMTLQNFPYLEVVERQLRKALHRWAKVPGGASSTIVDLFGSEFDFDQFAAMHDFTSRQEEFQTVLKSDFADPDEPPVLAQWARACCLLCAVRLIRGDQGSQVGIRENDLGRSIFVDYEEDYEEIALLHRNLAKAISQYRTLRADEARERGEYELLPDRIAAERDRVAQVELEKEKVEKGVALKELQAELRKNEQDISRDVTVLLRKVYTFLACAVRSRQNSEAKVLATLEKLGFRFGELGTLPFRWQTLVWASAIGLIVWPLVLFGGPELFDQYAPTAIDKVDLKANFPYLPIRIEDSAWWAVTAIVLHVSAAWVALKVWSAHMVRGNAEPGESREDRMGIYLAATVAGIVTAFAMLGVVGFMAAVFDPGAVPGDGLGTMMADLFTKSWMWLILPGITALFAVLHTDSSKYQVAKHTEILWMVLQGALMAGFAYVVSLHYTTGFTPLEEIAPPFALHSDEINLRFGLFVAVIVGLIGGYFGWLFPYWRRRTYERQYLGRWLLTLDGRRFLSVEFDDDKEARGVNRAGDRFTGTWKPKGSSIEVNWNGGASMTATPIKGNFRQLEFVLVPVRFEPRDSRTALVSTSRETLVGKRLKKAEPWPSMVPAAAPPPEREPPGPELSRVASPAG